MLENSKDFDIVFVRPKKFEDITKYVEFINDEKILHMNFEDLDIKVSQRVIDFIGGANYAKEGELVNVGEKIFCVIPKSKKHKMEYQSEFKDPKLDEEEEIRPNYGK